jgi:probable HAF family extracellular repeat protein
MRLALALLLSTFASTCAHAGGWKLTLFTPGGEVRDLNAAGELVGDVGNAGSFDVVHGFTPFGFLPHESFSSALAVNAGGVAAGYGRFTQPDDSDIPLPVAWVGGVPRSIPQLADFPCCGWATGVNDAGTIVGFDFSSRNSGLTGPAMAFTYAGGALTPLGTLDGGNMSSAWAINAQGDVVGASGNDIGFGCLDCVAYLYHDGAMTALGLLPGTTTSVARAINDVGLIVGDGTSASTGYPVAFMVMDGVLQPIPGLAGVDTSTASAVNSAGQVVGTSGVVKNGSLTKPSAYLYSGGKLTNLSKLAPVKKARMTNLVPMGIGDDGRIVGQAVVAGVPHGFMLTPPPAPQDP